MRDSVEATAEGSTGWATVVGDSEEGGAARGYMPKTSGASSRSEEAACRRHLRRQPS